MRIKNLGIIYNDDYLYREQEVVKIIYIVRKRKVRKVSNISFQNMQTFVVILRLKIQRLQNFKVFFPPLFHDCKKILLTI